jgi:hypothetical protein
VVELFGEEDLGVGFLPESERFDGILRIDLVRAGLDGLGAPFHININHNNLFHLLYLRKSMCAGNINSKLILLFQKEVYGDLLVH